MRVSNILAPEQLAAIRQAFIGSSVIVEHRFLYGGRAPDSRVFDDYEDFEEYLRAEVRPATICGSGATTICAATITRSRTASSRTQREASFPEALTDTHRPNHALQRTEAGGGVFSVF